MAKKKQQASNEHRIIDVGELCPYKVVINRWGEEETDLGCLF